MWHLVWMVAIAAALSFPCGPAAADETDERLQQLEDEVKRLREEVDAQQSQSSGSGSGSGLDFEAIWKDGFYIQSKDKEFQLNFGGRVQLDGRFMENDHPEDNTFLIRRARLGMKGKLW